MTTTGEPERTTTGKLSMAEILEIFTATGGQPLKFTAYDGSTAGDEDAVLGLDLRTPRGATYLATAPGELGLARAYVSGDLQAYGVHPGDPYVLLKTLTDRVKFKRPSALALRRGKHILKLLGNPDRGHPGPAGARLASQIRPHHLDLAVVLAEPHHRDLIVGSEMVNRRAERGADSFP
jgi:hypothetical protein